jgi:hypothetical protein
MIANEIGRSSAHMGGEMSLGLASSRASSQRAAARPNGADASSLHVNTSLRSARQLRQNSRPRQQRCWSRFESRTWPQRVASHAHARGSVNAPPRHSLGHSKATPFMPPHKAASALVAMLTERGFLSDIGPRIYRILASIFLACAVAIGLCFEFLFRFLRRILFPYLPRETK